MSNERNGVLSVEDDVAAAIAELKGETQPDQVIPAADHNAVVEEVAGAAEGDEPAEGKTAAQLKADARGNLHGDKGKFAPKPKEGEDATPPAAAKGEKTAAAGSDKVLQPPPHWTPQAKAEFVNAPRALQEQALKREEEISGKTKEWQGKAEDYNRLDKILSPHRDRWQRAGMQPDAAINTLIGFETLLASDPVKGVESLLLAFAKGNELRVIDTLVRRHGLQLVKATNQGDQPSQGNSPAQADPTVSRLVEQVQFLTSHLTQRTQAEHLQRFNTMVEETKAFAAKPENIYYENLKGEIADIVERWEKAGDKRAPQEMLSAAYEQAGWANPQVRPLLLQEQQKKAQAEQAKRAAAARHAAGSVTGSPGSGRAAPPVRPPHQASVEDDVRAAMAELSS